MRHLYSSGKRLQNATPIWDLFKRACAAQPKELLVDATLRLSGPSALALANSMAAVMGAWNTGRIGFLCRPSAAHAAAWFAAHAVGAVPVNLHIKEVPQRLGATLDLLQLDWLVCDWDLIDLATTVSGAAPHPAGICSLASDGTLKSITLPKARHEPADGTASQEWEQETAAIILSSGSTGQPKAICHSAHSMQWAAAAGSAVYGRLSPADAILISMGTSFAAWTNTVLPFVAAGAKLCFETGFDPARFVHSLHAERITVAALVPSMWNMVLQSTSEMPDLGALRAAMTSGEPVRAALARQLHKRICTRVQAAYLSSEGLCGTAIVADERDLLDPAAAGCIGRPIAFTEVRIVASDTDEGERDALPGEAGELLIRGPSMALGYLGQPELSRERFIDGWWRTGDVAFSDADGRFFACGRIDNLINSGGVKVHAEEVEAALGLHPAVQSVAVVGVPDPTWGQRVEAFVVLRPDQPQTVDLLGFLEQQNLLPRAKRPKAIHLREALPLAPTGKLYRKGLLA